MSYLLIPIYLYNMKFIIKENKFIDYIKNKFGFNLNELTYEITSWNDLEDEFLDNYGDEMEKILQEVHDKLCPDTDILLPIAYMAKAYTVTDKNEFSVTTSEGVFVEVDSLPGKDTKLVIVPNPLRIVLNLKDKQQVVWVGK